MLFQMTLNQPPWELVQSHLKKHECTRESNKFDSTTTRIRITLFYRAVSFTLVRVVELNSSDSQEGAVPLNSCLSDSGCNS